MGASEIYISVLPFLHILTVHTPYNILNRICLHEYVGLNGG